MGRMTYKEGQVMVDGSGPFMPREKAYFREKRKTALKHLRKGTRLSHILNRWGDTDYFRVVKVDRETGEVTIRFTDDAPGM